MTIVQKPFSDIITFTRASGGGRFNSSGVYEWLGNDVPRLDYDPVTLQPKGLLIEEQRTNLLTYSEQFDNAAWAKSVSSSWAYNSATAPDGTSSAAVATINAASLNFVSRSFASLTSTAGSYTYSVYLRAPVPRTVILQITNAELSAYVGQKTVSVTTAWQRFDITFTGGSGLIGNVYHRGGTLTTGDTIEVWGAQLEAGAFPTSYIPTPTTFTSRASTATYFNSSGVLTTAAINEARYDHRFIDGQWVPTGLFLEAAATNYLTNSGVPNGLADTTEGGLVSAVATGWGNGLPANGIAFGYDGTTLSYAYIQNFNATDNTQYTLSVFVKMDDGQAPVFGSNTGSSGLNDFVLVIDGDEVPYAQRYSIQAVGGGVYRVSGTYTTGVRASAAGNGVLKRASNSSRTFVVTGYQLELGAVATSYIPTGASQVTRAADVSSSAQVTRSADVASVNTLSPWFNQEQGTLFVEAYADKFTVSGQTAVILRQSTWFGFRIYRQSATNPRLIQNTNDGKGDMIVGAAAGNGLLRLAGAYSSNGIAFSANGGGVSAENTPRTMFSPDALIIGRYVDGHHWNGHIQRIEYYPRRLSNTELQEITA